MSKWKGLKRRLNEPRQFHSPIKPRVNEWEEALYRQIVAAELPKPERQYPFAKSVGRQYRADFAFLDERLIVEVNGGAFIGGRHVRGAGYENDLERNAIATALGFKVMGVTPRHIRSGFALRWIECALGICEMGEQWANSRRRTGG